MAISHFEIIVQLFRLSTLPLYCHRVKNVYFWHRCKQKLDLFPVSSPWTSHPITAVLQTLINTTSKYNFKYLKNVKPFQKFWQNLFILPSSPKGQWCYCLMKIKVLFLLCFKDSSMLKSIGPDCNSSTVNTWFRSGHMVRSPEHGLNWNVQL